MQLLPPILRSKLLVALANVLVLPLRYVYERFRSVKNTVDDRLAITGNVQYLEKALNDAFYLKDHQIYIETPEEEKVPSFYYASELQEPCNMYLLSEGIGFVPNSMDAASQAFALDMYKQTVYDWGNKA